MKKMILIPLLSFCANMAFAQANLPRLIHFDGQLLDSSNNPLTGSQSVTFQILPPTGSCVLHEEVQSVTPDSYGNFSVKIGPTSSGTQTAADGNLDWSLIFQNSGIIVNAGSPTTLCPAYTPASGHSRLLRVIVGSTTLSPDFEIATVPFATVAESLQGKMPSDFLSIAGGNLTGNVNLMTGSAVRFYDTDGSNYVSIKSPSLTANVDLTWPVDDGSSGQVLTTDGNGVLSWSAGGGSGLTSLNGLTASTQTFAVGTAGTAPAFSSSTSTHTLNIPYANAAGVASGTISKSEYDYFAGKLSAVAGSSLTSGNIWVGNGSNQATAVAMTGDATLSNAGVLTIANGAINASKILDANVTDAKIAGVSVNKIINGSGLYLDYAPNNTSCANGNVLQKTANGWECGQAMTPNQPIVVAHGTFSSPSISFMGDSTSGLFRPATGEIGFSTMSQERLRIDGSGYVGIGNMFPTHLLSVGNSPGSINEVALFAGAITAQNNSPSIVYPIRTENLAVNTGSGSGIKFLGVNTLSVEQTYGAIYAKPDSNTSGSEQGSLYFVTGASGNTVSPAHMVIKGGSGNVGVGTINPTEKLDVLGGVKANHVKLNQFIQLTAITQPFSCGTPERGTVYFDSTSNALCVCNGSAWRKVEDSSMACP